MYNIPTNTLFTGKRLIYLPSCHSTNDYASSIIHLPETVEGTIVITSNQTKGKGQRGNTWEAEPNKNLTFSLILNPLFLSISSQFHLNMFSSLAVQDTLIHYLGQDVKVKWPNDLYYKDKKICGILIQNMIQKNSIHHSIIGIGININQEVFSENKAISMKVIKNQSFDLNEILNLLLENLEKRYLQLKSSDIILKSDYIQSLYRINQNCLFSAENEQFEGMITGIDETGKLRIETKNGVRLFSFKEVEFVI